MRDFSIDMKQYTQFAQNIGLLGITNLFVGLQSLVLLPILTKNLPIDEYGIWVQITVTVGLIPSLVMLGLPYSMVRYLAAVGDRRQIQEGFYSIAAITFISAGLTSIIFWNFSDSLAKVFFNNKIAVVHILALLVFLECINLLQYNYFRTFQQIKRYSFLLLLRAFFQVFLAAVFVLKGYGILGAVAGYSLASLLLFLIMGFFIVSEIGIRIPKFQYLHEYLLFGLPTVPGNLSSWVVDSSDRYIIGILLGVAFVGYYAPGYGLGNIIANLVAPLSFLLPVVLSRHYDEGNLIEVYTILFYSMKFFLLFAIPAFIGLSFLSTQILLVLSTPEIAYEGFIITPFIGLAAILFGIYMIIMQVIILEKKTKIIGIIWIVTALINIGLNFLIVPYFGIIGAAFTTLLSWICVLICILPYSKGYFSSKVSRDLIKELCRNVCASLCMVPIIVLMNPTGIIPIIFTICLCIAIYFVVTFTFKGIRKEEIRFLKNCIHEI